MQGTVALLAGFDGACQHSPQKDNLGIQKFFPPLLFAIKVDQNIFFPGICFAYTIFKPEFTVWFVGNSFHMEMAFIH